jgi:hypothetical protein
MKMRHYLTKVGAVCDGQQGAEVAPNVEGKNRKATTSAWCRCRL